MIQLTGCNCTVRPTIMPKHCAEFRNEPQSLCYEISAIFGGTWCITVPHPTFEGDVSPCPRGIYATAVKLRASSAALCIEKSNAVNRYQCNRYVTMSLVSCRCAIQDERSLRATRAAGKYFLMIRRPPRSTQSRSSAASDVYKRQDSDIKNFQLRALTSCYD